MILHHLYLQEIRRVSLTSDSLFATGDSVSANPAKLHFNFNEHMHNVSTRLQQHYQQLQTQIIMDNQLKHPVRKRSANKASTYGINYFLSHSNGSHLCGTPWATRRYSPGVNG